MTKKYTLGLYMNGSRGLPGTADLEDVAGANIECLLQQKASVTLAPNLASFAAIPVRYSRDITDYFRKSPDGIGGNLVELWTGIRDFELLSLGITELTPETGSAVQAPRYYMLSTAGLQTFVATMLATPADDLVLWMWGHGQGPGVGLAAIRPAIMKSPAPKTSPGAVPPAPIVTPPNVWLSPGEIEQALANALPATTKLGLITFESCQAGTLELASSLSDHARVMIASQAEVPSESGWLYPRWPSVFANNADAPLETIAIALVDSFMVGKTSAKCMSALALDKIPDLLAAVGTVVAQVMPSADFQQVFITARKKIYAACPTPLVMWLGPGQRVDIVALFQEIRTALATRTDPQSAALSAACQVVIDCVVNDIVKNNGHTPDMEGMVNGLAIWFPAANNAICINDYATSVYFGVSGAPTSELAAFKKATNWDQLMKLLIPQLGTT